MKTLGLIFLGIIVFSVFVWAIVTGFDKELKRQCIVAQYHCEQYRDAGACDKKFMKICEGVQDEE